MFSVKTQQLKNGNYNSPKLNHVDVNLKPQFLIKSGYHIVPSPSTALVTPCNFVKVGIPLNKLKFLWAIPTTTYLFILPRKKQKEIIFSDKIYKIRQGSNDGQEIKNVNFILPDALANV